MKTCFGIIEKMFCNKTVLEKRKSEKILKCSETGKFDLKLYYIKLLKVVIFLVNWASKNYKRNIKELICSDAIELSNT